MYMTLNDVVGLGGLEPPTSRLSGVRSNHLSYKPIMGDNSHRQEQISLPRKEVIQPQVLLRLPCYDFTPVTGFTLGSLNRLRVPPASMV